MWYNDILIIVMGVIALLMIIMAVMVGSSVPRKQPEKPVEEEKPETILVERGFENHTQEKPAYKTEEEEYIATFMKPEETEPKGPTIEIELEPIIEPEEPPEEPIVENEPEPVIEPEPEPEPISEEPVPTEESIEIPPSEPIALDMTEETPEEQPAIITIEPIIIEPTETEYTAPTLEDSPSIPELEEDNVVITPNETFYDPTPEESEPPQPVGEPPELEEEIEKSSEVELPPLEEIIEAAQEEIEPDIEEPTEPEPVTPEKPVRLPMRRIRKPIIDESDPALRIDLGVETCPHCGSKVPNTIYCIYCGKPLDPANTPGEEEEETG